MIRYRYSKHKNVIMSPKFSPFIGERYLVKKYEKEGKYRLWYAMQTSLEHPDSDIRIIFSGPNPIYLLTSTQAFEEFHNLVPSKIDRWGHQIKHFGRMAAGAVDQIKSSPSWKYRRDTILHTIGINVASRYIPMVLSKLDILSLSWKVGEYINFTHEVTSLTFDIITIILFGKDIRAKIGKMEYIKINGETIQIDLMHYFHELVEDLEVTSFMLINRVLPFLEKYELTTTHKALQLNIENLWGTLLRFLDNSDDKESVYYRIKCRVFTFQFLYRYGRRIRSEIAIDGHDHFLLSWV